MMKKNMYLNESVIAVIVAKDIPLRHCTLEDRPTFNIKTVSSIHLTVDEMKKYLTGPRLSKSDVVYNPNIKKIIVYRLFEMGDDGKRVAHATLITSD